MNREDSEDEGGGASTGKWRCNQEERKKGKRPRLLQCPSRNPLSGSSLRHLSSRPPPPLQKHQGLPLQPGALTVPSSSGVRHLHGFKRECVVILTRLGPGARSSFLSLPSSQS